MKKIFLLLALVYTTSTIAQQGDIAALTEKLDSVILAGIDSMAFPGAELVVARKDTILIQKSYGYHTYERKVKVENHHLYDLASITKVSTGLLLLMKMVDAGLIDLDKPVSEYLPYWRHTNKSKLTFRQVLTHQAGLQPYIVFWKNTLRKNGTFKWRTFRHHYSKRFPIKITDNLFLHRHYKRKMIREIKKSPVVNIDKATYKYSGLFFLTLPDLIENVIHADFKQQLQINFYDRLELDRMTYKPLEKFPLQEIVPTEKDTFFRKCLVHGYVHDESAAMLDSKSCNAGMFANAENLARLFRMLMNDGKYKGKQLLSPEVIHEFTRYQYPEKDNRRGLGYDKPQLTYDEKTAYISRYASPASFGHSGFTGTFVWADPESDLLIVFLSNRVHPYRANRKLYTLGIRQRMHDLCYEYLGGK